MHQRIIKAKKGNLTKNDIKNSNGGLRQLEFLFMLNKFYMVENFICYKQ